MAVKAGGAYLKRLYHCCCGTQWVSPCRDIRNQLLLSRHDVACVQQLRHKPLQRLQ